jgi:hypothetical protein
MDADVERFLEESRTFFPPEECDAAERVLRGWYEKANDSPGMAREVGSSA